MELDKEKDDSEIESQYSDEIDEIESISDESIISEEIIDKEIPVFKISDFDEEEEDDDYLQKFEKSNKEKIIEEYHPELQIHNYDEVKLLSNRIENDPLHKTIPFLTKYEKARILGERAKQLNAGAKPFIKIDDSVIDGYLIALEELQQKKIPFIIKRPLPNGGCEYWKLKDLEVF